MVTDMMVTVPARNRSEMLKPNSQICRVILTVNLGAWYPDQRTRGNIHNIICIYKSSNDYAFRKLPPLLLPKNIRRFVVGYYYLQVKKICPLYCLS